MNINITISETLKEKLTLMNKVYSANKKSEAYPEAVKLDEKGMLHAVNATVSLSYKLGMEELGMMPTLPEKAVLLPDGVIRLLLATTTGTEVTVSENGSVIEVKAAKKKSAAKFSKLNDTFPTIEAVTKDNLSISQISSDYLDRAIKSTLFSISDNNAKPIYTGLHFIAKEKTLTCFSCSGFTSAIHQTKFNSEAEFTASVPKETVAILQTCLKSASQNISLGVVKGSRKAIFMVDSQTILRTTLLSGELLDYNTVFNTNKKTYSFEINSKDILNSLKKMLVINDNTKNVPMITAEITDTDLNILFKGVKSEYSDVIEINHKGSKPDQPVRIGLNINFLADGIKAIGCDKVVVMYSSALSPITVTGTEDNTPKVVVVPMRLAK